MTSSVTPSSSVRPAVTPTTADAQKDSAASLARRPGRDWLGRPQADKDVWGGLKTKEGKAVNTGDGIDPAEAQALADLAVKSTVEFVHRMGADSANGTPVSYRVESPIPNVGTAFAEFTARDGNLLIESGISIDSATAKNVLQEYLAPEDKQNDKPVIGKLTLTGKINRAGEIGALKANAMLSNVPKLSSTKLGDFERTVTRLLRGLSTGQVITDEMKKRIGTIVMSNLRNASRNAVELFRRVITDSRAFEVEIRSKGSKSAARLDLGQSALDIQASNLLDEVGKGYPRVDGTTKVQIDKDDRDTVDLGTLRVFSTENLLVNFEGNKPHLFRIEADGSRTPLKDVFGEMLLGLPFLLALLKRGK